MSRKELTMRKLLMTTVATFAMAGEANAVPIAFTSAGAFAHTDARESAEGALRSSDHREEWHCGRRRLLGGGPLEFARHLQQNDRSDRQTQGADRRQIEAAILQFRWR